EGRTPATSIVVPVGSIPRRSTHRNALSQIVEEGVALGDTVVLLLPDGWTQEQSGEETHWFDPNGVHRLRHHVMSEAEATGPQDQIGEWTLTPLARYFKRTNSESHLVEFVDRASGQTLHSVDTTPTEPHKTDNGVDVSPAIGYLVATWKVHSWAERAFPDWQDPSKYWD